MSAEPNRPLWRRIPMLAAALALSPAAMAAGAVNLGSEDPAGPIGALQTQPLVRLAQASPSGTQSAISPYLEPAPDIFEASGRALWDGKRTLQGIWVAHPLATTARRVRIINTQNGRAADGALFKRDTTLAGPSVLISSEAAQLLGMTPGESAELRIVAVTPVRRTEPAPVNAEDGAIDETAKPIENKTVSEAPAADPKPEPPAAPAPEPAATATEEAPARPETPVIAAAPVPSPRPDAEPEPETEPEAKETAKDPAPESQETTFKWESPKTPTAPSAATDPEAAVKTKPIAALAPAPTPAPQQTREIPAPQGAAAPPETTTEQQNEAAPAPQAAPATRSEPEPEPALAQAKPEPEPDPTRTEPKPEPEPAQAKPEPEKPQRTAAVSSPLRLPYVQAGVFGVRSNATKLVARLKKRGIPALTRSVRGGKLTRVIAGPFQSTAARNEAQRKIRALGLKDAVPVKK